jgi:hypothetical protein
MTDTSNKLFVLNIFDKNLKWLLLPKHAAPFIGMLLLAAAQSLLTLPNPDVGLREVCSQITYFPMLPYRPFFLFAPFLLFPSLTLGNYG